MKILVIGAGSIGKRHAGNARDLGHKAAIIDVDAAKAAAVAQELKIKTFDNIEEGLAWKPQGVIIATPHGTHIDIASQAVKADIDVLVEKPISHVEAGIAKFLRLAKDTERQIFVCCNLRYHPALLALKEHAPRVGKIYFARAHYGEHLPTMRPGIDYRKIYAAKKSMGGGIILDVIHDIDYLAWILGPATQVTCETEKRSDLEIDVEDYASLSMRHASGARSEMHLDYLQKYKQRGCEIVGENGVLIWKSESKNPERCNVKFYDDAKGAWETIYECSEIDHNEPYRILLRKFIKSVEQGHAEPDMLTGEEAYAELKTVLSAYLSAEKGRRIHVRKIRNAA